MILCKNSISRPEGLIEKILNNENTYEEKDPDFVLVQIPVVDLSITKAKFSKKLGELGTVVAEYLYQFAILIMCFLLFYTVASA